ncbi:MAG: polyhydroxyalkanoate synthesis repressor PhaR [Alphaproteobacteria bacterium]
MAKNDPVTIKKYANRRLYNTGTSTYVTLEDLAAMVKGGEDFVVFDAKTGEDITRSVLAQIIFEQEAKVGQNLLPIPFLRQLIRFYGDSVQLLVPRYLEMSIDSFSKERENLRNKLGSPFGIGSIGTFEEVARRNMEMFERAFSLFNPFVKHGDTAKGETVSAPTDAPAQLEAPVRATDLDELKQQLADMQSKIDALSRR